MAEVAVVTGSTRGIGFETALGLGLAGCMVIVTGRSEQAAVAAARRLGERGVDAHGYHLEVTSTASVQRLADDIERDHGRLDVLVNNAGIAAEWDAPGPSRYVHPEAARRTVETNVIGVFHMVEAMLPLLRRGDSGRIVNVSSFMGSLALQSQADPAALVVPAYQASKAALNSLTITLSKVLADTGITVYSVDPGFVQTDFSPINRAQAPLTAAQGAEPVVAAAMRTIDAASGSFVSRDGVVPW
ncbi:SDR family NAD(P)-dependent oxidoreductase [Nocardia otitidiscaviarum]|uniref:SDR family NAD(P)-dependent oxidoreductase n=1 Tax=Nocardia otitidiscaviarum TaxID=1823 RepID=UPI0004A6DB5D|nr:SDR family NAD(P)-dependent oxidoreductase [Nocardia otitidiscaviarum]MBF6132556.1 SDR family NAD(P)-dependent oxidoreductase [Nocardia otitidiscaviarum]MBF6488657.1 SDR family NAD(P)-dependent oxidoreductase [Nocardia otitidiscaviarum]